MSGANCHYGLIFTPTTTYVLRDDFTVNGPQSIRVSGAFPTEKLLGRLGTAAVEVRSEQHLARLVREWLELLATSYEAALPDDADVTKALFPEIVAAVAEGRVVAETSFCWPRPTCSLKRTSSSASLGCPASGIGTPSPS